jgi:hypothetical protein
MSSYLDGGEAFRLVLDELLESRRAFGELQSDLKKAQKHIQDLNIEHGLHLSEAGDHIAREKTKIIDLGSKLYMAAHAVKDALDNEKFLRLREALHESANTFDEIPF